MGLGFRSFGFCSGEREVLWPENWEIQIQNRVASYLNPKP